MYTVEMLPAAQGDCLWIEYGDGDGAPHRILIDGGTVGTIDAIKAKIDHVVANEGRCRFDLVVVTHVDGDHIEGVIRLLGEPSLPVDIDDIWFNGYNHLPDPDGADADQFLGAKQGDFLSVLIKKRGLRWNDRWGGETIYVPPKNRGKLPRRDLPGGMEVVLLSPTYEQLLKLSKRWDSELQKAGLANWTEQEQIEALLASRTLAPEDEFLGDEDFLGDEGAIDVAKLVAEDKRVDKSPANGSSIAFLATYEGTSCLFSGDAYSSVLEENIDRLAEETRTSPVVIDAYKTPHHASRGNVHDELLAKIECRRFLVSTSGARFRHPDRQAIARLVGGTWRREPANDRPVELFFNYDSSFNAVWRASDLEGDWNYTTTFPTAANPDDPGQPGLKVTLA
jgi:hypothetical protein